MLHPTAESNGTDFVHDASSIEYMDGPIYSIDFELGVGVEPEEPFPEDVASVTTHGSADYDDVASDPPPPRAVTAHLMMHHPILNKCKHMYLQ